MEVTQKRFVRFATTQSLTETINMRLLLDRAQIPYRVVNETLGSYVLGNLCGVPVFGAVEFHIPGELEEIAQTRIKELYSLDANTIPDVCPACEAATVKGVFDCPDCGLTLA
jgi:hypothetical protein